jgi:hypothetical protein
MALMVETLLGVVMLGVGIVALAFINNAINKFPDGSELQTITKSFIPITVFLMLFSLWHVLRETFHWKKTIGEFMEYPEYIFISLAYIMLFLAAKKIYELAKQFGATKE